MRTLLTTCTMIFALGCGADDAAQAGPDLTACPSVTALALASDDVPQAESLPYVCDTEHACQAGQDQFYVFTAPQAGAYRFKGNGAHLVPLETCDAAGPVGAGHTGFDWIDRQLVEGERMLVAAYTHRTAESVGDEAPPAERYVIEVDALDEDGECRGQALQTDGRRFSGSAYVESCDLECDHSRRSHVFVAPQTGRYRVRASIEGGYNLYMQLANDCSDDWESFVGDEYSTDKEINLEAGAALSISVFADIEIDSASASGFEPLSAPYEVVVEPID